MQAVEQTALLESLGLRRVEVLRGLGVGTERAAAEADDAAGRAEDREHQPVAEAVPGPALVFLADDQTGGLELLRAKATTERAEEEVVALGCVAQAEALRNRLRDSPRRQ